MIQLTEIQIAFIRKNLSRSLENLDFIEEMTDHFILDIERQLNEGIDIQTAFLATKNSFGDADGLQKLEKTFVKSFKKGIYNEMKQMYLQILLKTPQNILLVLFFGCLYYFFFKDFTFQATESQTMVIILAYFATTAWYGAFTWKYTTFQSTSGKNAIMRAKNAIIMVNFVSVFYFHICIKAFTNYFDTSLLSILSTFVFCNLILWTYCGTKILRRMQKNKVVISQ